MDEIEKPPTRAYPGNADVRRCRWYADRGQVEVHLWGLPVPAVDSRRGEGWAVRSCVVCGAVDEESLQAQYATYEAQTP
jgi:hypothetical protein